MAKTVGRPGLLDCATVRWRPLGTSCPTPHTCGGRVQPGHRHASRAHVGSPHVAPRPAADRGRCWSPYRVRVVCPWPPTRPAQGVAVSRDPAPRHRPTHQEKGGLTALGRRWAMTTAVHAGSPVSIAPYREQRSIPPGNGAGAPGRQPCRHNEDQRPIEWHEPSCDRARHERNHRSRQAVRHSVYNRPQHGAASRLPGHRSNIRAVTSSPKPPHAPAPSLKRSSRATSQDIFTSNRIQPSNTRTGHDRQDL